MAAILTPGITVRITRTNSQGRTHFIKTGTVGAAITCDYFEFTEDIHSSRPGAHVYVTTDESLPARMKGWTQRTEIIGT